MMGTKQDGGKYERHLLPTEVLAKVAGVFRYGADKYAENNWRGGMPYTRMLNAVTRHLDAWLEGEELDPESGHHHLAHAITGLMMLFWWVITGRGRDDRWKGEVPVVAETNPKFAGFAAEPPTPVCPGPECHGCPLCEDDGA